MLQVLLKVELKLKDAVQSLSLPLCYAYYTLDKLGADDKQTEYLLQGDGTVNFGFLDADPKHENPNKIVFYPNFEHANKMNLSKHLVTPVTNKSYTEIDRVMVEKERIMK